MNRNEVAGFGRSTPQTQYTGPPEYQERKGGLIARFGDVGYARWIIFGRHRVINAIGFAVCVLMLVYAWYLQYYENQVPCPLCLVQRFDTMILGLVFLAAAIHNRHRRLYGLLIMVVAAVGAITASYHVWLQHQPITDPNMCMPPLHILLNAFPLTEVIDIVLESSGDCGATHWTLMGLSIPAWTLIIFVGLGALGVIRNWGKA